MSSQAIAQSNQNRPTRKDTLEARRQSDIALERIYRPRPVGRSRVRGKRTLVADGCQTSRPTQGIAGQVLFLKGDFMPGPGAPRGSRQPVQRVLYIYPPQTKMSGSGDGFYPIPKGKKPVATLRTCPDGHYHMMLPVGTYSIFVLEDGRLWANTQDGGGVIGGVHVSAGQLTEHPLQINYQATY